MRVDHAVDVLGVRVSAIDLAAAVDVLERMVKDDERGYVTVTGVHGVMESQRDRSLLDIHNDAAMVTPDGMPLVWAGRRAGAPTISRVYGPDLLAATCERAAATSLRMFFFGGGPGVADALADRLVDRYGITVVGTLTPGHPPEPPSAGATDIVRIEAARPDMVWVGLSTPKQERWMAAARPHLTAPVLVGVGAAFDMHAGLLAQAPQWMQTRGLEWAYRLAKEPRRLWRRYLRNNPAFVLSIARRRPALVSLAEQDPAA